MQRMYKVENKNYNRNEFEKFLVSYITTNKLHLQHLIITTTIEKNVKHHPYRIAQEIFGQDKVKTWVE